MPEEISDETKHRHVVNAADAREQASEGRYSFMRSEFRRAKGGEIFEIPHRDLLDNDQQERWEDLQHEIRQYDREPDIYGPPDADGNKQVIARGALIFPHLKNNERVRPSWPERLAIVLWGEDGAARAKAGGVNFNEIEIVWEKQRIAMQEREADDPKSEAGGAGVAAVSDGDRS